MDYWRVGFHFKHMVSPQIWPRVLRKGQTCHVTRLAGGWQSNTWNAVLSDNSPFALIFLAYHKTLHDAWVHLSIIWACWPFWEWLNVGICESNCWDVHFFISHTFIYSVIKTLIRQIKNFFVLLLHHKLLMWRPVAKNKSTKLSQACIMVVSFLAHLKRLKGFYLNSFVSVTLCLQR